MNSTARPQLMAYNNKPDLILGVVFLLGLEAVMLTIDWGVLALNGYIALLFLAVQPPRLLHPNTMIFAFYGLWIVFPSTLDFLLESVGWIYEFGRPYDWSQLSKTTLIQVQMSITTLTVMARWASGRNPVTFLNTTQAGEARLRLSRLRTPIGLVVASLVLSVVFVQLAGGLGLWLGNYARSFVSEREGVGALSWLIVAIGSATLYMLGLNYFARRRPQTLLLALIMIAPLAFTGGIKSRTITLLVFFAAPFLLDKSANPSRIVKYLIGFFVLLYVTTLLRTNGFYSGGSRYLEQLARYFNAYPLHDQIVRSRDPSFMATVEHLYAKPGQALGFVPQEADFDVSVMLTKEYFPEQWYRFGGTQQWPIETDMWFNFMGPLLQVVPLGLYGAFLGKLYRLAAIKGDLVLLPIYISEFFRVVSTLRGTLIPWQAPAIIVQYVIIYLAVSFYLRRTSLKPVGTGSGISKRSGQAVVVS